MIKDESFYFIIPLAFSKRIQNHKPHRWTIIVEKRNTGLVEQREREEKHQVGGTKRKIFLVKRGEIPTRRLAPISKYFVI